MTHYGITGFGTAKAFAKALELEDDQQKLELAVEDIYQTDELMSELAESAVNVGAARESSSADGYEVIEAGCGQNRHRSAFSLAFNAKPFVTGALTLIRRADCLNRPAAVLSLISHQL